MFHTPISSQTQAVSGIKAYTYYIALACGDVFGANHLQGLM
ncbi:protein of unknown function [Shewanella benthica]|uniref:Uncharacterized protein n=1 Tax=Shewanella benthica TaxID=43661 RepID=A0A330M575_9GAMM|nr:protein of unknown function [Shewanella benthica]